MRRFLVILSSFAVCAASAVSASTTEQQGFVKNLGQIDGSARYYAQSRGSSVYFEPGSVLLDRAPRSPAEKGIALRVEFPNAVGRPAPRAGAGRESQANVFVGRDPSRWRAGIPIVDQVRYDGVAPGTDLVYHVADGRLEYDLELAPGAELSNARLRYRGAQSLSLGADGSLSIHTAAGTLTEAPPVLYQEHPNGRVVVAGGFRLVSKREIGFWAASYDRDLPLVVDPGLMWSTFLGGGTTDCQVAVATNAAGESFLVGYSASSDYPTSTGAYQRTKHADDDVIVTKLRADGSLAWSTYLGGSAWDAGRAVAVDGSGNVYLTGETLSSDFPVTAGAFDTQVGLSGTYDAFVVKLGPNGDMLSYSTYLGGVSDDKGTAIAVNSSGQATVGGNTGSSDFPTTLGVVKFAHTPGLLDGGDGFVTKLNPTGTGLVYSTYIGSNSGTEQVRALALNANGEPTLTGPTASPDFPTTSAAFSRTLKGIKDAFVTRLNATGSAYVFSTYVGGGAIDDGFGLGVDANGNTYAVGATTSTDFPVSSGAFQTTWGGGTNIYDGFVVEITPTGGRVYGSYLGGSGSDVAYGAAVRSDGTVCVTGVCTSTNFPVTSGAVSSSFAGGAADGFVTVVAAGGSRLLYSSYLGSSGNDQAVGIALRANGSTIVAGYTDGANYPTSASAYDRTMNGGSDAFVSAVDVGLGVPTGVGDPPVSIVTLGPSPNPFLARTAGSVTLSTRARLTVRVLDLQGRLVRKLIDEERLAGSHAWSWDGADESNRPVPAGTYLLDVTSGSSHWSARMTRLR